MIQPEIKAGANITVFPVFKLNTQEIDERVVDEEF
jgi:hypothetical protein